MDLADHRREFDRHPGLNETSTADDAIEQFNRWFEDARRTNSGSWFEPNAMTLATVDAKGLPKARIVLLKGIEDGQFVFFTNTSSAKGRQLAAHPHAALVFYWPWLDRQVRIEGPVEPLDRRAVLDYAHRRPRGSQLSALASQQSQPIDRRESLEKRLASLAGQLADTPDDQLPVSDDWGGYRVRPVRIEFWQGRENRLHDRLVYDRQANDTWSRVRLQP